MALYYNLVFVLLVFEMALFAVLSLPLPSKLRGPLIRAVSSPFQSREVTIAIRCIIVFVLVLFVDSVNRVATINEELTNESIIGQPNAALISGHSEVHARKFYAQRNLYLTGFTLFLTLIVSRTYGLVAELLKLKEEVKSTPDAASSNEKVQSLLLDLEEKDEKIDILKKQAESLRQEYDAVSDELAGRAKTTAEKKVD